MASLGERVKSALKQLGLAAALAAAYCLIKFIRAFREINRRFDALDIPGPKSHWILGSIPAMAKLGKGSRYQDFARFLELRKMYGDLVKIRFVNSSYVVLYNVDHLKTVAKMPKSENYDKVATVLGYSILTLNGDKWKKHRRMLSHGFTLNEFRKYFSHFTEKTETLMDVLKAESAGAGEVDFSRAVTMCTLDIISSAGFGFEMDSLKGKNANAAKVFAQVLSLLGHPAARLGGNYGAKLLKFWNRRGIEVVDGIMYKAIDDRLKETVEEAKDRQPDLLDLLVETESEESGTKFTRQEIRDECFVFFVAGHETTALTLQWTMALLATHPQVLNKLVEEVERVCPNGRRVRFDDLNELKYMKMVLQETLRLYPPASAVTRQAETELYFDGHVIPEGMGLFFPIMTLHRDRSVWGEKVDEFDPDAHFSEEAVEARDPMYFIPFSFGPRQCIGQHFFWVESRTILATLLQDFEDFELLNGKIPPFTLRTATTHPEEHIRLRMKRRVR